jgi:hypothetical protein
MKHGIALIAFALAAFGAHAQTPATAEKGFPAVSSTDLNGKAVSLPADFPGPASLVFVAFERRQQEDVDTWKQFAQEVRKSFPSAGVFELPVVGSGYKFMRFVIDNGMKSGIPSAAERAATITLYIDVGKFARDLGLETTKQIAVFVVRPSGEVLARTGGRWSEAGAEIIRKAVEEAH